LGERGNGRIVAGLGRAHHGGVTDPGHRGRPLDDDIEQVPGLEAHIDGAQAPHARSYQAGSYQDGGREGNLRDHHRLSSTNRAPYR
jgi:hypothetical protein